MSTPHVLVIGGGFGGLEVAKRLARADVRVTLVDRRNHHLFQPLLYQVATAALAPGDIAEPIRRIVAGYRNVSVRLGDVGAIDLTAKTATLSDGTVLAWDKLILAAGARHSYFGHPDWAEFAPGLKTVGDALELRHRMLAAFERAEWATDADERRRQLTFVVIGAGPTGVEMAGAIAEIAQTTMLRDFRNIDTSKARVVLVEATEEVLPGYPDDLRRKARAQLAELGVEVRTGCRVTGIDARGVSMGEERIPSAMLMWAAGVEAEPLTKTLGVPLDRNGRVQVLPDLSMPGHPDAFAIGDVASFVQDGKILPGVAQVAMQMGDRAAANVRADLDGAARKPFAYWDLGKLATVGRRRAVADLPGMHLAGFFAWFIWVTLHLWVIVAFRSRVVVFLKWAWLYLSHDRGSRLMWAAEGKRLDTTAAPAGP